MLELAACLNNEANSRSLTASAKYAAGIRDDNVKNKAKEKGKVYGKKMEGEWLIGI